MQTVCTGGPLLFEGLLAMPTQPEKTMLDKIDPSRIRSTILATQPICDRQEKSQPETAEDK
jgi:hypothetical protein